MICSICCWAAAEGRLADIARPSLSPNTALTVVMAAKGYPGIPEKGGAIGGIVEAEAKGAKIFHAGTALRGGAGSSPMAAACST